ncbi:protein white isoform X2 [Parasteatoda tepidariorum]|uniref:protein white isoform X2 n=1 Tax=Parasteatoda tepidariorum TaxID=114398 RepID=UPI00077FAE16|nr:protein white isoform X2 [Parasteatoda tepidariorum]
MAVANGITSINSYGENQEIYHTGIDIKRSASFDPSNKIFLTWHNVSVFVKPKQSLLKFRRQSDANESKQLLFDVCGEAKPGQLLAIMGSSGAGKTTLLNVLTNRNLRRLKVNGEILVNGQNVGESIVRLSAYVRQDDLFIGTLTVREHLVFQALLRMDKQKSYAARMQRVDEVIVELGLKKCTNTLIGIAGRLKGISGGEAKRLAFASEIITNPSLMFCDEPTSGLDSFMSQSVISVLRDMAHSGRTIVCVIHQPSSEVFELFDHLLLMAEGRVAYRGRASRALEFFERAGLRCPVNYNPADFYIHNLAIVPGNEEECRAKVAAICDQFDREQTTIEITTSEGYSFVDSQIKPQSRYKAGWFSQFRAVLWRSWISLIREPMLTKVRFLQSIVIALILGLVYLNQSYDEKGVMNINGALFLLLMNLTFQNMFSVVNAFTLEQPIFLREHWNGMYRTDIYFLSKTLAEAPILLIVTALFVVITYWMIGLNSDPVAFAICLVIFTLIANTAASFGYMVSCLSNSLNVALSIGTPLLMPLILFGGFYLNAASVPVYFIWLKYISWFYYGNEALIINQWSSVQNITCSTPQCPPNGKAILKSLDFYEENLVRDLGVIIALMVALRILAFLALLVKSMKKT